MKNKKLLYSNVLKAVNLYKDEIMGTVKSNQQPHKGSPSTFAMLVDDINKMSESEQKALWVQINRDKLANLAKEIDASVTPHNFNDAEIDALIHEAMKNGRSKKKG